MTDIFNGAKFLPTLRDLKKLAWSRGISSVIFIIFFLSLRSKRKGKKALIPPLGFSKNIPCRILPAPFLFLIFRIPPEVLQVL